MDVLYFLGFKDFSEDPTPSLYCICNNSNTQPHMYTHTYGHLLCCTGQTKGQIQ